MSAFSDFLTATAVVWRNPDGVGMVARDTISVMPVMPVGQQLIEQLHLNSLREPWQTFCADENVLEGDQLVIASTTYIVRWIGTWPWSDSARYLHIIGEEMK